MKIKYLKGVVNLLLIFVILIVLGYISVVSISYFTYSVVKKVAKDGDIYIYSSYTLSNQASALFENGFIADTTEYLKFANKSGQIVVNSGKYTLKKGMTYKQMMSLMSSARQTPVNMTFNNIWSKERLASKLSTQIELDSLQIIQLLNNDSLLATKKLTSQNALYRFIPNTYQVYWNIKPEKLIERMCVEYEKFWNNNNRKERLKAISMTKDEVTILASIVEGESNIFEDMKLIAGVYINRLNKNMPLQADPTVVYANGDRTIKRVTHKHTKIDSPFNTYKYKGLPPFPISVPSIKAIDAVLNYTPNDYLYFCASPSFDGTHRFASHYSQHRINAKEYSKALNKAKIY